MRKLKRIIVSILAMSMVFSSSGVSVLATEGVAAAGSGAVTEAADDDMQDAGLNQYDNIETGNGVDAGVQGTETPVATEKQKAFEYVYVDEQTVNIPEEQNIAVVFADTELILESAILHYSSVETGMAYDMPASNIVENTVLFTKVYEDAAEAGEYQLDSITYRISGQTEDVNVSFAEQEVTAGYVVTTEPEIEEPLQDVESEEAVPEVTVYSMDDEGNTIEQSGETENIESTVEEVLEVADADGVAEAAMAEPEVASYSMERTRTVGTETKAGNKVIVICAGHDTRHTGARGNGLQEEQLTWKVANYCKAELEQYQGVTVYLDRNSINCAYPAEKTSYCVEQRVKDAAAKGASVFVDIHFNSVDGVSTTANGAEIYYPNNSYSTAIHQDGKNLAENILAQLTALGLTNRGAHIKDATTEGGYKPEYDEQGRIEDYFTTINESKANGMTGIIVEHAFLDNAGDAAKLKNESFLKQLGVADANGIAKSYGLSKGEIRPTIKILNKDDYLGTAEIKIDGVGAGTNVAIWSEINGQDDLVWTGINGSGTIKFNIKDFKNSTGNYNVHMYNADNKFLASMTFRVSTNTSSELEITNVGDKDTQYKAKLTFKDMPSEITKVHFPTWGSKDQSDLKWYEAKQTSKGVWEATFDLKNHLLSETYKTHVYVTNDSGVQRKVGEKTFTVSTPSISSLKVENYKEASGTFDVVASGISSKSGVEKVMFAVWSTSNQSNLVWYTASKQSDGSYKTNVKLSNHQNKTGVYNIHAYVTCGNGIVITKTTTFNAMPAKINISAQDVSGGQQKKYQIKVSNLAAQGSFRNVDIAVWSQQGGQDDLVWYGAGRGSDGTWSVNADISGRHKTAGTYDVHVYGTTTSGKQQFLGNTTFVVDKPAIGTVGVRNYKEDAGTFDVIVGGISSKSGVSKVLVAVWSEKNQGNLVWYTANKQSDGTYKVPVNISNHQSQPGTYNIHAYLTSGNGIEVAKTTTQKVTLPKINISVQDISGGQQKKYQVKASNLAVRGNFRSVDIAVWSQQGGQDDLVWYGAGRGSDGTWSINADISGRHKTAGTYDVHVYGTTTSGKQQFLGNTTFVVDKPTIGTVDVRNYKENAGTFDVIVGGISSKSGVSKVQVAVWSEKNQGNLVWYTANRQSDGTYKVPVNISNHQSKPGTYNIHAYLTSGNGIQVAKTTTQKVTLPKINISVQDTSGGQQKKYQVKASNLALRGNFRSVDIAVWSQQGGQDDLVWYGAGRGSDGTWSINVDISGRHKTAGTYNVHVYGTTTDGNQRFLDSTTFNVDTPTVSSFKVQNYNEDAGTFEVVVSGITSKSGVSKVMIPVWSTSNQSDLIWYTASKQNDGSYKVFVNISKHKGNTGTYNIHMYLTAGNGIEITRTMTHNVAYAPKYTIMGTTSTTVEQMVRYYNAKADYPAKALGKGGAKDIQTFCRIYIEEAEAEGVRAEVAFAQAMNETGFLKYGGIVKIEQFNFAGLGALDGNKEGDCASFKDVRTGIRAQIQHLKAYATTEELKQTCVDPRYHLVKKASAPYVQWLGIQENPTGNGWATEKNYGYNIVNKYIKGLLES